MQDDRAVAQAGGTSMRSRVAAFAVRLPDDALALIASRREARCSRGCHMNSKIELSDIF
ncbi:protein of unknown function [Pararobbsia alpina]